MDNQHRVIDLLRVVVKGDLDMVERLLEDCSGDLIDVQNHHGVTALHCACSTGYEAIVRYLLEKGSDPNIMDRFDNTSLHYASWSGYIKIVELLLKRGININVQDETGNTALHDATVRGHPMVVQMLLYYGADPMIKNKSRPGTIACQLARTSEIRWIFELHKLNEWRPWNHTDYPLSYRQAMRTLVLLAKSHM